MAVDVGSAVGYLDLDISGFLSGLKTAQDEANRTSKNIATKVGNNLSSVGKNLTSAGSTLTKTVTAPLVTAGTAAFTFSTKFESAMAKVSTIADATQKPIGDIKTEIVDLSNETGAAATDIAEAVYQAISAGVDTADAVEFVAQSSKLATAGFTDTATAVDALTTILNAYGLEAADAGHVSDVLISTQNKGKTTVNELAASMGRIIPTANAMGVSLEDLGVAYSYLTAGGIATAESTTYLNSMFNELGKSGTDVSDILKEKTGKSFQELVQSGYSVRDVLDILQQSADEAGLGFNDLWSSQEAGKAALALLNTETEDYNATLKDFQTTQSDTEEAFNKMADTTEYKLKVAMQNGKNALMQLGDTLKTVLLPFIEKGAEWIKNLNEWLSTLSDSEKEQIVKIVAIVAAIGPLLMVLGKLTSSVGSIITTFGKIPGAIKFVSGGMTKLVTGFKNLGEGIALAKAGFPAMAAQASRLGAAIGGISAPTVAVVAVIGVLIAALVTLWKTNEDLRDKIKEIWGGIINKFKEAGQKITDALNSLGFNFTDIIDVIKSAWEALCNFIGPIFIGVFEEISALIGGIVDIVTGVIQVICGIIKGFKDGDWSLFLDGLQTLFEGFISLITAPFQGMFRAFEEYLEVFGTTWDELWSSIASFFKDVWNNIKTFFIDIWNGLIDIVSSAWQTIKNVVTVGIMLIEEVLKAAFDIVALPFAFIWENCKETVISAWNTIKDAISNAINFVKDNIIVPIMTAIQQTFTIIWNAISSYISSIWNTIKTNVSSVMTTIKNIITNIWNEVKSVIQSIMNVISETIYRVWNTIRSNIAGVINSIKDVISNGLNAAKSVVSNILNGIKNAFVTTFSNIKNHLSGVVNWLKGVFNFKWSLPHIKLPHFKVSGSFNLNPPSVPSFGIDWYDKAMKNGMIMNSPTLFGFDPSTGKFMGGGETGSETVVGTKSLMMMIGETVSNAMASVINIMKSSQMAAAGDIVIPVYIGNEVLDTYIVKAIDRNNFRSGGR